MENFLGKIIQLLNRLDVLPGKKRIIGGIVTAITSYLLLHFPDLPVEHLTEVLWWVGNVVFTWGIAAVYARGKAESTKD